MISAEELVEFLESQGIKETVTLVFDEDFVMPTEDWITDDLSKSLTDFFFYNSKIKYEINQFDCNKFAKFASVVADLCWAETKKHEAALAFGVFAYVSDAGPHAINVAVHRADDSSLKLGFYEPQPAPPEYPKSSFSYICLTPRNLTKEEVSSCLSCLFV